MSKKEEAKKADAKPVESKKTLPKEGEKKTDAKPAESKKTLPKEGEKKADAVKDTPKKESTKDAAAAAPKDTPKKEDAAKEIKKSESKKELKGDEKPKESSKNVKTVKKEEKKEEKKADTKPEGKPEESPVKAEAGKKDVKDTPKKKESAKEVESVDGAASGTRTPKKKATTKKPKDETGELKKKDSKKDLLKDDASNPPADNQSVDMSKTLERERSIENLANNQSNQNEISNAIESEKTEREPEKEKKPRQPGELTNLGRSIWKKNEKKGSDYEFTINDLNSCVGADRKLVVNDSFEFWVHDAALTKISQFFQDNLGGIKQQIKNEGSRQEEFNIIKSYIYVPHPEYFFDILTWIYSRDNVRLSGASDEPESFLCILNLAIFLSMGDSFFKALLQSCEIKLDEELFSHHLWSRLSFTFDVLVNLLKRMPDEKFLRLHAILHWLKEDNTQKVSETFESIKDRELELLTSKDYFLAKRFISDSKLLVDLPVDQLILLKERFTYLIPALDTKFLIENFVVNSSMRIACRVCKRVSNNVQDFIKNECEVRVYHPKQIISLQKQMLTVCELVGENGAKKKPLNPSAPSVVYCEHESCKKRCEHESCKKRFLINEYPCCHKPPHVEGCVLSDGKHIMSFDF